LDAAETTSFAGARRVRPQQNKVPDFRTGSMLSKKSPFLLVIAWIALGGETWSRFWLLVVA
jgi:hypothetical protein